MALRWVPKDPLPAHGEHAEGRGFRTTAQRIDLAGILGFAASMTALIIFLMGLPNADWIAFAVFAAAAVPHRLVGTANAPTFLRPAPAGRQRRPQPSVPAAGTNCARRLQRDGRGHRMDGGGARLLRYGGRAAPAADGRTVRAARSSARQPQSGTWAADRRRADHTGRVHQHRAAHLRQPGPGDRPGVADLRHHHRRHHGRQTRPPSTSRPRRSRSAPPRACSEPLRTSEPSSRP
jgi:hypothetical protein